MYAQFFGLRELPFNNTPDPRFFYSTPDHEEALALLVYAVSERKEFAMLTGEIGAGKTLVSRMMLKHFGSRIVHAIVNHAVRSGPDLLEVVCTEFGLEVSDGATQAQLTRQLHDYLLQQFARNTPVVLLLDEAQNLPVEAFEQLRMIGNLESDDAKLLQIIIVGQPELRQVIASPALRQLAQRVFRSFHLPALTRSNTEEYIRHRLSVAGSNGTEIFEPGAIDALYTASGGLPRVINTLCDNVMLSAFSAGKKHIDRAFAEMVITQTQAPRTESKVLLYERRAANRASGGEWQPEAPVRLPAAPQPIREPVPTRSDVAVQSQSAARFENEARHLRAVVDEVLRRLEGVENAVAKATSSLVESRTQQAEMGAVVAQAKAVVSRVDTACRELRQRELSVDRLVATGRSMMDELGKSLSDARKSTTELQQKQRAAHETAERLAAKIHEAHAALTRPTARSTAVVTTPRREFATSAHSASPVVANRAAEVMPATDQTSSRLRRLLDDAHDGLTGLRTMIRSRPEAALVKNIDTAADRTKRISTSDQTVPAAFTTERIAAASAVETIASSKLAANVDDLLKFVEAVAR